MTQDAIYNRTVGLTLKRPYSGWLTAPCDHMEVYSLMTEPLPPANRQSRNTIAPALDELMHRAGYNVVDKNRVLDQSGRRLA